MQRITSCTFWLDEPTHFTMSKQLSKKHLHRIQRFHDEISSYIETGDLTTAYDVSQAALNRYPRVASLHFLVAKIHHSLGRIEMAIQHLQKTCELDPKSIFGYIALGMALESIGEIDDALASFGRAVAVNPGDCVNRLEYGNTLFKYARYPEALDNYHYITEHCVGKAAAQNNIGNCYLQMHQLQRAIDSYLEAIQLDSSEALYHNNIATTYSQIGDYDNTLKHYSVAMEIEPGVVECHYNYTMTLIDAGLFDDAKSNISTILNDPHAEKKARRLYTQALVELGNAIPVEKDIFQLADDADKYSSDDSKLGAGLIYVKARYYDRQKQYSKAFDCFENANSLLYQQKQFDRVEFSQTIAKLMQVFDSSFLDEIKQLTYAINRTVKPIFILGMPRSGTTVLQTTLSEIAGVSVAGELEGMSLAYRSFLSRHEQGSFSAMGITQKRDFLEEIASVYMSHLKLFNSTGNKWPIDKMPANFLYVPLIHSLFPDSLIIHSRRNALDNCLSCYFSFLDTGHAYSYTLDDLAFYYAEYQKLIQHWHALLPARIIDIDYEMHVENKEIVKQIVIQKLRHKDNEEVIDTQSSKHMIHTLSAWQARQGMYVSSINRWKNYGDKVIPLKQAFEKYSVQI